MISLNRIMIGVNMLKDPNVMVSEATRLFRMELGASEITHPKTKLGQLVKDAIKVREEKGPDAVDIWPIKSHLIQMETKRLKDSRPHAHVRPRLSKNEKQLLQHFRNIKELQKGEEDEFN